MAAFVFDVDGTLTPSRSRMDPAFARYFLDFQRQHETYIVTGSDYAKTQEQLGYEIPNAAKLVFSCCGNEVRRGDEILHKSDWSPDIDLLSELGYLLEQSKYPVKTGQHIELRTGLVNFSIVGRSATVDQRADYVAYDRLSGERDSLAIRLSAAFPDLEIVVAGDTGLDIYPLGADKSQILKWFTTRPIVFFGDRTLPGGNDYPLACVADLTHAVEGWEDTWDKLRLISPGA
jgi:phosphomannomutase